MRVVSHFVDRQDLELDLDSMKLAVHVHKCKNVTLKIKGKFNQITLDSCERTNIVFEDLIAGFDCIRSEKIEALCSGAFPLLNIDQTKGFKMVFTKKADDYCIVNSVCSSAVWMHTPNDDDEFDESPLPEQYESKWVSQNNWTHKGAASHDA